MKIFVFGLMFFSLIVSCDSPIPLPFEGEENHVSYVQPSTKELAFANSMLHRQFDFNEFKFIIPNCDTIIGNNNTSDYYLTFSTKTLPYKRKEVELYRDLSCKIAEKLYKDVLTDSVLVECSGIHLCFYFDKILATSWDTVFYIQNLEYQYKFRVIEYASRKYRRETW